MLYRAKVAACSEVNTKPQYFWAGCTVFFMFDVV